jgi:DNA-binding IclR family transcriptional regulator
MRQARGVSTQEGRIPARSMTTKHEGKNEAFYNRSLERALQIMTAFSNEGNALSLAQLSEALGLSKATVFRLCATLIKCGFLRQDQQLKQYSLGMKLFELGSIAVSSFSLTRIASPYLTQLQVKLGKTVFLGVLDDGELLYLDKREDPTAAITFTSNIGRRRPSYWGMIGPAIIAYLPPEEIDRLLEKTPLTVTTKKSLVRREELDALLKRVRERGYAIDEEMAMEGVGGVAAPVRDFTGKVVAAVGVGFFSSLVGSRELKKIAKEVVEAARAMSREAGYTGTE